MKISELIALAENKLASISSQLAHATQVGDIARVVDLAGQQNETETTLEQLKTLL